MWPLPAARRRKSGYASVEMIKGRAVPPSTVVAEQKPFFITLGGPKAHDSSVEKHSQESAAEPQVPPLRCAPVGMTRERRFQKTGAVFITMGGRRPMTPPVRKIEQISHGSRALVEYLNYS